MIKTFKNKGGMTLMEIIVGLAICMIVLTATASIVSPMFKVYVKANDIAEYNTLLDDIANQIISDISESTAAPESLGVRDEVSLTIYNPADVIYSVNDRGMLYKKTGANDSAPVFVETYYKNKRISFICDSISGAGNAYMLTVTIFDEDWAELISREYAVKPLVLNQN